MLHAPLLLLAWLAAPAVVAPEQVPASGAQRALLTVERTGMFHLSARSEAGTACQVVDHLRGPFAAAGRAGDANCELDLLLDAGRYLVRLDTPLRSRGRVELGVQPFAELQPAGVRLDEGQSHSGELKPGQQLSFWIHRAERGEVNLRVFGRTAGVVRLWRGGEWVEDLPASDEGFERAPGQPIHAWRLEGTLEAGDYRLTVYGAEPRAWSRGTAEDFLFVAHGFPEGPVERGLDFVLPAWGRLELQVTAPADSALALLGMLLLDRAPEARVSLRLRPVAGPPVRGPVGTSRRGGARRGGSGADCRIEPKALVPECAAVGSRAERQVLVIQGPPGERGRLRWAPWVPGSELGDELYTSPRNELQFEAGASGNFLVAVDDVPDDPDALPLACELAGLQRVRFPRRWRDLPEVGNGRTLERRFNTEGRATIRFRVTDAGMYELSTGGEQKLRCELFDLAGREPKRLSESQPEAGRCELRLHLGPGEYALELYGGEEGIESVRIGTGLPSRLVPVPRSLDSGLVVGHNACTFTGVGLEKGGRYALTFNRTGRLSARGLALRELPLRLERPLTLTLDPSGELHLPLAAGAEVEVRGSAGAAWRCGLGSGAEAARNGLCRVPASGARGELVLTNSSAEPLRLLLRRTERRTPPAPLAAFAPTPVPLPRLKAGERRFLDFEREQAHDLVFEVSEPGLYHLTTEGLLATACLLRSPTAPALASASEGGRGRNCLVAGYLRAGRYLARVQAQGRSRGRAAVVLERRAVKPQAGIAGEGEVFFRVEPGALVEQDLTVRRAGRYRLYSGGQNIAPRCRLEDAEGWPLLAVPCACQQELELGVGRHKWLQLPLTVESMRRTELRRVREPQVLKGDVVHRVQLNQAYQAELGADGRDEFRFELGAELEVFIELTGGMQGRVLRGESGVEVVALVTPQGRADPEETEEAEEDAESQGDCGECEECDGCDEPPPPAPPALGRPAAPAGVRLALARGVYRLATEHSRGDVGIFYRLRLGTERLAPGVGLEVPVPGEVAVRMPETGVLRLGTEGQTDVRCRLFDAAGHLLGEGSDVGEDWNCLLALPLVAGDYRLVLEAEGGLPGATRVRATAPPVREVGELRDGLALRTEGEVLLAGLPDPGPDALLEVGLRSRLRFSCLLEDVAGTEVARQLDVLRCGFLIHHRGQTYRLRVWNRRWTADAAVRLASRPIASGDRAPAGGALRADVPRTGRYRTAERVWCAPASSGGLLRFCGPQASLEEGPVLFSTTGATRRLQLELREVLAEVDEPRVERERIGSRPEWQRQRSAKEALALLAVELPQGETASPACRIDGGVARQDSGRCFAAGGPGREALARWWLAEAEESPATLRRRAVVLPEQAGTLEPGASERVWSGPALRLALPVDDWRLRAVLPSDGWALWLAEGRVRDLCPPDGALAECSLEGRGGELVLVSDAERRARLRLLRGARPVATQRLEGLFERVMPAAGSLRLVLGAAAGERLLEVEGTRRCLLTLEDGRRRVGCRQRVPAGGGGELWLEHEAGPVQVVLAEPGRVLQARWGRSLPADKLEPLQPGVAAPLPGAGLGRSISLAADGVLQLRADGGVCALVGPEGLLAVTGAGIGCALDRPLVAGTYRLLARPFGSTVLAGELSWNPVSAPELLEGVGPEEWIAPGEVRSFRFRLRADGDVGLGVRTEADRLECRLRDEQGRALGEGCQQLQRLRAGTYWLTLRAEPGGRPLRFRPAVLGLAGSARDVPEEYLRDFFRRIGFEHKPKGGER